MKRVICLLNLLCIASLGCCSLNRRINIIVPGHYFGVDALNESRTCDLIINQISEEEYLKADGKNVIQDAINGNFFSIDFSIIYSEDNILKVVFTNFKDAYNGATGTPICYNDEKKCCWFSPYTTFNREVLPASECYYSIHISHAKHVIQKDFELYTYLYFVKE